MTDQQFEALLDLMMCSDPWPLQDEARESLIGLANSEAKKRHYDDWVDAFNSSVSKRVNQARGVKIDIAPWPGDHVARVSLRRRAAPRGAVVNGNVVLIDKVVDLAVYDSFACDPAIPMLGLGPAKSGTYVRYVEGPPLFLVGLTPREVAKELGIKLINEKDELEPSR